MPRCNVVVAAVIALASGGAHANTRGVFRIGVEALDLEPRKDTPLIGGYFDDAVTAYNAASASYNQMHGASASAPIDRSALGVHARLVTFAPGFEAGGDYAVFRLEGILGISDQHRTIGVGMYPIDLAIPLRRGTIVPYLVAGGTASWLDRTDVDGEVGALVSVRVAAGVRLGRRVTLEVGCGLFVLGGLVDNAKLQSMSQYDPRGSAPPPSPARVVSGGEESNLFDFALGVAM